MTVTGIQCPRCDDKIWSRHTHDYRRCSCGCVFVDGGRDYLRYGYHGDEQPHVVEIAIDTPQ